MSTVSELRAKAGHLFAARSFLEARAVYVEAAELAAAQISAKQPEAGLDAQAVAVLFSNMSACSMQLGNWSDAESDALCAVRLAPRWSKAHHRLAMARDRLGQREAAAAAIATAMTMDPMNTEARQLAETWRREAMTAAAAQAPQVKRVAQHPWIRVVCAGASAEEKLVECARTPSGSYEIVAPVSPLLEWAGLRGYALLRPSQVGARGRPNDDLQQVQRESTPTRNPPISRRRRCGCSFAAAFAAPCPFPSSLAAASSEARRSTSEDVGSPSPPAAGGSSPSAERPSPSQLGDQTRDGATRFPGSTTGCSSDDIVFVCDGSDLVLGRVDDDQPVAVYEAHALRDLLLSLRARLDAEPQLTAGVASGVMTREELLGAWQVSYNLLADQLAVDDPTRFRPVRFFTGPSAELAED